MKYDDKINEARDQIIETAFDGLKLGDSLVYAMQIVFSNGFELGKSIAFDLEVEERLNGQLESMKDLIDQPLKILQKRIEIMKVLKDEEK